MHYTVRDVAKLLNVSERSIYRWINNNSIPAYKIHEQYRFNKMEILEWANLKKIGISLEMLKEVHNPEGETPTLEDTLKSGGIYYRISGNDKKSVLMSVVENLKLPESVNREYLLEVLLAREELSSTGIGEGIAIPHVRNPIIFNIPKSLISLCFLEKPIDFGSIDDKPVHALFLMMCATPRIHLGLLSRLSYSLKDEKLKQAIINQASREEILTEFRRVESQLKKL
ncbi:MAG: hypothetical protein ACD_79C00364G0002 [uncultured bacterium]|nr:MAG: hypothetical protein ACD_79C00364G0002 [uncultured bacterium]